MEQNKLINNLLKAGYLISPSYGLCKKSAETYKLSFSLDQTLDDQLFQAPLFFDKGKFDFQLKSTKTDGPSKYDSVFLLKGEKEPRACNKIGSELKLKNREYLYKDILYQAMQRHYMSRSNYIAEYKVASIPPENLLKDPNGDNTIYWESKAPTPPYWIEHTRNEEIAQLPSRFFKSEMWQENLNVNIQIESWKALDIVFNKFESRNIACGDVFNGETIINNKVSPHLSFEIFSKEVLLDNQTITVKKLAMDGFTHAKYNNGELEIYGRWRKEAPRYCIIYEVSSGDKKEYVISDRNGNPEFQSNI